VAPPLEHGVIVRCAAFASDGTRVVTAADDGIARIWETSTGRLLSKLVGHSGPITRAEFSPDGRRVATASDDGSARIWDAGTGVLLVEPLRHAGKVTQAAFGLDGLRLVTASLDETARVWDVASGQPLSDPLPVGPEVFGAGFCLDGLRVFATAEHSTAIWSVPVVSGAAPTWLPGLAETMVGMRINEAGVMEPFPPEDRLAACRRLRSDEANDSLTRWMKWQLSDPLDRTLSPDSPIRTTDYVCRLVEENTLDSLDKAVSLSPTNALAYARLALAVLNAAPASRPGDHEAAFLSRYAQSLAPKDTNIQQLCRQVLARMTNAAQVHSGFPHERAWANRSVFEREKEKASSRPDPRWRNGN